MFEVRTLSVSIPRDARELYEAIWRPEVFPLWASGLSTAGLKQEGESWAAHGPAGPIRISFTGHNEFGVMDHRVELGGGRVVDVPMRVLANGEGAEVTLTLFRQDWMTPEQFAEDEAWVRRDLARLAEIAGTGLLAGPAETGDQP
jgi:hypothetical protein